jgi:hypothetical protein
VGIMQESEKDNQSVLSPVRDLRDIPLSSVSACYADEVRAIVHRMVDDAQQPAKPPVAAFSSFI